MATESQHASIERRRLTYALHTHRDLDDAFAALPDHLRDDLVVEALGAFLGSPRSKHVHAMRAVELLAALDHPAAHRALGAALEHRLMKVRRAAAIAISPGEVPWERVVGRLRVETAQLVRVKLVALLARAPDPIRWEVAWAADDPHWRVRKQVIASLEAWADVSDASRRPDALRARLASEVSSRGLDGDRARGLLAYLELSADPGRGLDACAPEPHGESYAPDLSARPWWHVEPSLMREELERLTREEVAQEQVWLVWLLVHPESRFRARVRRLLLPDLGADGLVSFMLCLTEPRQPAADASLGELLARLSGDVIDAAARRVLELDAAHASSGVSWTLELGMGEDLGIDPAPLVRWARSWLDGDAASAGTARPADAPLSREDAERILGDPDSRASWTTLERAAERCATRLDRAVARAWTRPPARAEPRPERPIEGPDDGLKDELIQCDGSGWWARRQLGPTSLEVSRMGITGHYNLPERGFAEAMERGINLYFWEPIYVSQTRYFAPLSAQAMADVVMCSGTFEATARGLRADVERALRSMKLERMGVFFVFWVRDRERLSDELLREMDRLRDAGLVDTFGVSTHSRELARGFIEEWPVVMVRHNAAHRGAEREVLPHVDPARAGIISFSNLCYGRMIAELPDWSEAPPSARDAYRYSLSHAGVTSCWSAPSTRAQLRHNLSALSAGAMTQAELDSLRRYGAALYRRNTGFDRFVRRR